MKHPNLQPNDWGVPDELIVLIMALPIREPYNIAESPDAIVFLSQGEAVSCNTVKWRYYAQLGVRHGNNRSGSEDRVVSPEALELWEAWSRQ
jgi:hypothetical protein